MKIKFSLGYLRLLLTDFTAGTNFLSILDMIRRHQYMEPQELNMIRENTFTKLLEKAKNTTAYYSNLSSYDELSILYKEQVKNNFNSFVSNTYKGKIYKKSTGGSTGIPLVYLTTPKVRSFLWAGILLSWEAAGYKPGDRVAFIAGTSILKKDIRHLLFYKMMNIEVFSAFTLEDTAILNYLQRLKQSKVKIIYAYASALQVMAQYVEKNGPIHLPYLKSIISTAEVLTEKVRQEIRAAFNVPVYNQYGCNEAGVSAFECEYHHMHLISTRCKYETDANGGLVSSDLSNDAFFMLKYHTGDIVEFSDKSECQCGRTYPVINKVIGRTFDIIRDTNNQIIHSAFFSILFRNDSSIRQFQIVVRKDTIEIHLNVSGSSDNSMNYNHYLDTIKKNMSFREYKLVLNSSFLRYDNAKHRHVICLD